MEELEIRKVRKITVFERCNNGHATITHPTGGPLEVRKSKHFLTVIKNKDGVPDRETTFPMVNVQYYDIVPW